MNGEVRDERGRLVYAPRSNAGHALSEAVGDGPGRTTLHHNSADATASRARRPDEYGGRMSRSLKNHRTALDVAKAPIVLPMRAPIREVRR